MRRPITPTARRCRIEAETAPPLPCCAVTDRGFRFRPAPAASALACRRQTCGTRAGPNSAAGRRGRRRSAYEAPRAAADGGTLLGGAESKRRRRPRLPAPPSRVTLLGRRYAPRPQPAQVQAAQVRSHSSRTFVTPRNMKRRKPIACLLSACRRQTCGTRAGPKSAAGRRGRRRSAYEAPRAAADGGTRLGGAESKRRRRLRLPAPPSRVTLLGKRGPAHWQDTRYECREISRRPQLGCRGAVSWTRGAISAIRLP